MKVYFATIYDLYHEVKKFLPENPIFYGHKANITKGGYLFINYKDAYAKFHDSIWETVIQEAEYQGLSSAVELLDLIEKNEKRLYSNNLIRFEKFMVSLALSIVWLNDVKRGKKC